MSDSHVLKMPGTVWSGPGCSDQLEPIAQGLGATRAAVFVDSSLRALGLADRALAALGRAGVSVHLMGDVPPEPTYGQVQTVVDELKGLEADLIVAIGGGSVMDAAKLASVCATDAYTVHDLLADPSLASKQLPTVMVPTTAGTGAEATPNAIVAVPEDELKVGIVNDAMICDFVLLDADMIRNLPRPIAASTGLDALCHAIECFTSTKANPLSDTFALEAFDLILNNIEQACDDPDALAAKSAMQLASFYAGVAITASGTTAVHALSYPLGGKYHVAHGVSNAILLMPVLRFNRPAIEDRLAAAYDRAMAGDAQTNAEKAEALLNRIETIVWHLDIPESLSELGIEGVPVEELAAAGMTVQRLLVNNRRPVAFEDAVAIYQQII